MEKGYAEGLACERHQQQTWPQTSRNPGRRQTGKQEAEFPLQWQKGKETESFGSACTQWSSLWAPGWTARAAEESRPLQKREALPEPQAIYRLGLGDRRDPTVGRIKPKAGAYAICWGQPTSWHAQASTAPHPGTGGSSGTRAFVKILVLFCDQNHAPHPRKAQILLFLLSLLLLTQHLGFRSRVKHWLMSSLPDAGYWNIRH